MIATLAWRNIWRNRRRTLITLASIVFAIVFANVMDALLVGINNQMINSMVGIYSGHLQIQKEGFWEDKSLHNTFLLNEKVTKLLNTIPKVKGYTKRLESVALASADKLTKGVLVVGIEPGKEKQITGLEEKIQTGDYFHGKIGDAIIGNGLAQYLEIQPGDTLIMLGQGYHGASAAGKYHVCGTIRMGSPDLDNNLVFLSLSDAQDFFAAEERVTSIPVFLNDNNYQDESEQLIQNVLPIGFTLKPWQKMMPMVTQSLGLIDAMRVIVLIMLYLLISFSILGTIIMMTNERQKEFKILLALGMKKSKMSGMVLLESILIAIKGSLIGFLLSYPVVAYLRVNPITFKGKAAKGWESFGIDPVMPTVVDINIFTTHSLIILMVSILLSFYALNKIRQLRIISRKN